MGKINGINIKATQLMFVFILLNLGYITAQNTISGKIENLKKEPLPFANVILINKENSGIKKGAVSDENGMFYFENVKDGSYKLEISVFGFKTYDSDSFSLSKNNKSAEFNFTLKEDVQAIDEVVIIGNRPKIRQTAGKIVINLEKAVIVSSNLKDVVKKVPGIIIINGNITYGGQNNIRILINGKTTSYMDVNTLLRDLPADNIARVELIQQPGAEFDATGSGPLINIILNKNVKIGTNGNIKLNTEYTNDYKYGFNTSITSYKNKLNWQFNTGYRKSPWFESLYIKRNVLDKTYIQSTNTPHQPRIFTINGAIDYYINDKHNVGIGVRNIYTKSDRINSISTSISNDILQTENRFNNKRTTFSFDPYYEYKDNKNNLTIDFNFIDYIDDNKSNIYKIKQSEIEYNDQKYLQDGKYQIFTYKFDYKRTFNDNFNLNFGTKYSDIKTDSNVSFLLKDVDGNYINDENQKNQFKVYENIFAMYAKAFSTIGKWTLSTGLRWENSNTEGVSSNTNETRTRNISKLFPSLSIERKITETIGVNLLYAYRIERPSYNSLNAFVYYFDPYTLQEGNPKLKPEFTDSYQFSLTYNSQPFFSIGYKNTSDAIFEFATQNDITAQILRSEINLSEKINWEFKLFAPLSFIKGLDGYSGFIVNYNKYLSDSLTPKFEIEKWNLTWYTSVEYQLPWKINSEITGYYISGGLKNQIEYQWLAGLDFGLNKKFLKDQLIVNLGIKEVLNRQFKGNMKYDNIDGYLVSDWSRNNIYLQLQYNFGNKFNKKKKRYESSEEERDRIEDNK